MKLRPVETLQFTLNVSSIVDTSLKLKVTSFLLTLSNFVADVFVVSPYPSGLSSLFPYLVAQNRRLQVTLGLNTLPWTFESMRSAAGKLSLCVPSACRHV